MDLFGDEPDSAVPVQSQPNGPGRKRGIAAARATDKIKVEPGLEAVPDSPAPKPRLAAVKKEKDEPVELQVAYNISSAKTTRDRRLTLLKKNPGLGADQLNNIEQATREPPFCTSKPITQLLARFGKGDNHGSDSDFDFDNEEPDDKEPADVFVNKAEFRLWSDMPENALLSSYFAKQVVSLLELQRQQFPLPEELRPHALSSRDVYDNLCRPYGGQGNCISALCVGTLLPGQFALAPYMTPKQRKHYMRTGQLPPPASAAPSVICVCCC